MAIVALAPHAHALNLVNNGGFESPATATFSCFSNATVGGWTNQTSGSSSGSCYTQFDGPAPAAYAGSQSIYLNDNSLAGVTLSQPIAVTAGNSYQLSFALTGLSDRPTLPVVQVDAGSGSVAATFTGLSYGNWSLFNYAFTPSLSGLTPLTFKSVSGYIYLDAVDVQAVPEPSSYAMLLAGIVAVGAFARRANPRA